MSNDIAGSIRQMGHTGNLAGNPGRQGFQSPVFWGFVAGALMLLLYAGVLSIANSPAHAFEQFLYMWYWVLPLIAGFSLQVGLFVYIRNRMRELKASGASGGAIAASGGMSASSMVACCAHHLTELLPLLGLSAAAIFVTRFQGVFLLAGVISNVLGIIYMLKAIQVNGLASGGKGILFYAMKLNMRKTFAIAGTIGALTLVISIFRHL